MNLLEDLKENELPADWSWINEPSTWRQSGGTLRIEPAEHTDYFRSPDGSLTRDNAPLLATRVTGDFTIVARARASLAGFGDAATIVVREREDQWAKLCLERSPIGDVSLVSVVTRGVSDDANSELLSEPVAFLRATRRGDVFGFHFSTDGSTWRFVRTFRMDCGPQISVGIAAQAPYAKGCVVEFDRLELRAESVVDFRSGE
jgi:uncharacterized protein